MTYDIAGRLASLRDEMRRAGVGAVVMPRTDAHLSEYISDHWHIVRYFSSFTGSAGLLVVTLDEACLWVDSRCQAQPQAGHRVFVYPAQVCLPQLHSGEGDGAVWG